MEFQIRRVKYRRHGRWGDREPIVDIVGLFWVHFTDDGTPYKALAVNLYELEPPDWDIPDLIQEALDLPVIESNFFFNEPWENYNTVVIPSFKLNQK